MRAIMVDKPGGLAQLKLKTVPAPGPGRGQVQIRTHYAGCNWSDIQKRQGVYPDPMAFPAILGLEVAGVIAALGPGVRGLRLGDRVAAITGPTFLGGFADFAVVDAAYVIPLPEAVSYDLGAAFPVVALTAYHLLHSAYQLRKGETVLVHAIGGAVGLMLTQIARRKGAKVIGTVGSAGKAKHALAYGASAVVDRGREDFVEIALTESGGRGVNLVIDSIGADILERSFDALRVYGRVINIGEAAGYPNFNIRAKLYERSTALSGFELRHAEPGSPRWRRGVKYVLDGLAAGWLEVPIEGVYDIADCRSAQARLEGRGVSGKLLLSTGAETG